MEVRVYKRIVFLLTLLLAGTVTAFLCLKPAFVAFAEEGETFISEPAYEEPVYEEPVYEEPAYEEPVYEEPAYEEPVYEEPTYEPESEAEPITEAQTDSETEGQEEPQTESEAITESEGQVSIEGAEVTGIDASYIYTGDVIEPHPVVSLNGQILAEGADYTLTYYQNIAVGNASITISGIGSYVGDISVGFAIVDGTEAETQAETEEEESAEGTEADSSIVGFYLDPNAYPAADAGVNTRYIYKYLTNTMGLNHAAACGVLANIQMESGFNPRALGDGGTSYGICQWHNERFNSLISYCNSIGLDYNTLDGQLANLNRELNGAYSGILAYIRSVPNTAQGAYDAGYYWCVNFEVPNDAGAHGALRGNLAANSYFPMDLGSEEEIVEEEAEEEKSISLLRADMSLQSKGWAVSAKEDSSQIFTFAESALRKNLL